MMNRRNLGRMAATLAVACSMEAATSAVLALISSVAAATVADFSEVCAGKTDQVGIRAGCQPFLFQLGPTVVLVGAERVAQQFAQATKAAPIACDQQGAERLVAISLVLDPCVDSDNRLDADFAAGLVMLDDAKQAHQVGQALRGQAECLGLADGLVVLGFFTNPNDAVGYGKFGMQAQMDKGWGIHGRNSTIGRTRISGQYIDDLLSGFCLNQLDE